MWIVIAVLVILIIAFLILENVTFSRLIVRKPLTTEEMYKFVYENKEYSKETFDSLKKEEVSITTEDGYKLKGYYIEGSKEVNKTVILVHGVTVGIPWSLKYLDMFLNKGFSVLLYDQRRHGNSEGKYSTYGYREKSDLKLWVSYIREKKGKNHGIGLHGESMGAATVLQYGQLDPDIDFIIADCSFSRLSDVIKYNMKKVHVVSFPVFNLCDLKTRRLAKFKLCDINPIDAVSKTATPTMFIHGSKDDFIRPEMSRDMYNAKKGIKALYIAEGAVHACSIKVDKKKYYEEVYKFLDKVDEKK